LIENGEPIEIIFVFYEPVETDADTLNDELLVSDAIDDSLIADAVEYFSEMPWKMLEITDRKAAKILASTFCVSDISTLVLVHESGMSTTDGCDILMEVDSVAKILTWKEDKAAEIASMPTELYLPDTHEHALFKLSSADGGTYNCEVCYENGKGWAYHCHDCGIDIHPKCIQKALNALPE
jgi:nucleoredoxin